MSYQKLAYWQLVEEGDELLYQARKGPFTVWSWGVVPQTLVGSPAGRYIVRRK